MLWAVFGSNKSGYDNNDVASLYLLLLQTEFTPLHRWEREYAIFERMHNKPHFMHFRMWKQFAVWRRSVRIRKTTEAR